MAHLPGDAGTCVIREWDGILVSWNPTPWGKPNWGVRKDAWASPCTSQLKVRPSGCPGQCPLSTWSPRKQRVFQSLLLLLFVPRVHSISPHPLYGTLWPTFSKSQEIPPPNQILPLAYLCSQPHGRRDMGGKRAVVGPRVLPAAESPTTLGHPMRQVEQE